MPGGWEGGIGGLSLGSTDETVGGEHSHTSNSFKTVLTFVLDSNVPFSVRGVPAKVLAHHHCPGILLCMG